MCNAETNFQKIRFGEKPAEKQKELKKKTAIYACLSMIWMNISAFFNFFRFERRKSPKKLKIEEITLHNYTRNVSFKR